MTATAQQAEHAEIVRQAVLTDPGFLRLTFSGGKLGEDNPWVRVVVRPVEVQGRRRMLFSYWDGIKDITQHHDADDIGPKRDLARRLDELLGLPFQHIDMQTSSEDLHVRITKKGKVLVSRGKPSRPSASPQLAHDRDKERLLDPQQAQELLYTIGISNAQGRIRPGMGAKYRQVEHFLRVLDASLHDEQVARDVTPALPLQVVDCGCGSAYLTFAAYYYLNALQDIPARFYGVDLNAELIERVRSVPARLGWDRITFHESSIAAFEPPEAPDLVLSLHACDTATDDALARGVAWGSRLILSAPCCQHELHHQLDSGLFRPVLRHGILRERLADLLTDALRAQLLRIAGYRTQVIEFVAPEHTAKNLMIVATRGLPPGDPAAVEEYEALVSYWEVRPVLESLLGDAVRPYLEDD